jgi:hypothetical protein
MTDRPEDCAWAVDIRPEEVKVKRRCRGPSFGTKCSPRGAGKSVVTAGIACSEYWKESDGV